MAHGATIVLVIHFLESALLEGLCIALAIGIVSVGSTLQPVEMSFYGGPKSQH